MAFNFNGTSQFAAVHTSNDFTVLNGLAHASWSIWINRSATGANHTALSRFDGTATYQFELAANASDDFVIHMGNPTISASVTTTLSSGTWYYLTVTYDGTGATDADKVKAYIDGVAQTVSFVNPAPSTLPTLGSARACYIGAREGAVFFAGTVENAKIYTVTLNPSDVVRDMYSWAPVLPEYCVMWAPMTDLGADNAFTESSTQGWTNHAAVAGTSLVTGPGIFSYGAAARMPRSGGGERRHRDSRRNKFRRTGMTTGYPRWGLN